jgi:hypothetical protein
MTQEDLDKAEEAALEKYRETRAAVTAYGDTYREAIRTMDRLVKEQHAAEEAHETAWVAKQRGAAS